MSGYFYILTNKSNKVLYKGSTTNIIKRVYEHKNHLDKGSFTDKYNATKLVYYEFYESIKEARGREVQVSKRSRAKKDKLIDSINPERKDLYWDIVG
ncbi:GIY-YIG nuclease family protein [Anaerococcus sp.]|uniref:GIY-YIG nuclease family protein n=1 Tax=Anaerococcus sp. TaxID=1872515 RepID=UPI0027B9F73F|nr:GIY-YIG nuclease family protein [Anaerococcus sp.]